MKVLVAGGAGYIGSHTVKALGEKGHDIVVLDNLSSGHSWAVLYGKLVAGDLADKELVRDVLRRFRPDAVMHFAAHIQVEKSVHEPLKYYRNNVANTLNLLEAMNEAGIGRLIFSSSAAVYGMPSQIPVTEESPMNPVNPYGASKMMVEYMLRDLSAASGFKYVSLRYFNAAGADPCSRIGESHPVESHLIPLVLMAAKKGCKIKIFGTDYPTPDGTCIRDYIHVDDLASAHVLALDYLIGGGESRAFNCGYGHGYSVKEIIGTARKLTGIDIIAEETTRRPGDPPVLVADSSHLKNELGWKPAYDDIDYIVKTAWEWGKRAIKT